MKKYIIGFLMGMLVCGLISVSAAKYLYKADEVSYDSKDTTWNVDNVDSAIKSLYSMINEVNSSLTDLKNTEIAKAVGATGATFTSVIEQLGLITDQKDKSFVISNTNSVTIPAGYYNGHGTISTSNLIPTPTGTVTLGNGTHDVTNYKYAVVNVPTISGASASFSGGTMTSWNTWFQNVSLGVGGKSGTITVTINYGSDSNRLFGWDENPYINGDGVRLYTFPRSSNVESATVNITPYSTIYLHKMGLQYGGGWSFN